jgi:hypothetical protein
MSDKIPQLPMPIERVNPSQEISAATSNLQHLCSEWVPASVNKSDVVGSVEARVCDTALGPPYHEMWAGFTQGLISGVTATIAIIAVGMVVRGICIGIYAGAKVWIERRRLA